MKEIQKDTVKNPERGHSIAKSPVEFIGGLFKRSEASQISEIESLCSSLPQGDAHYDPKTGLSISRDDSTTRITKENRGGVYDLQSSLVISAGDQGNIEKIEYTLHQDDGTGTIPPIERVFDPSDPEASTLELREAIDYLEDATTKAQRIAV